MVGKACHREYRDAMTDKVFMEWLQRCPAPALNAKFSNKQMILVLDNPSYHHGYDTEVRVPKGNIKGYNTELLRKYKCKSCRPERNLTTSTTLQRQGQKTWYIWQLLKVKTFFFSVFFL